MMAKISNEALKIEISYLREDIQELKGDVKAIREGLFSAKIKLAGIASLTSAIVAGAIAWLTKG